MGKTRNRLTNHNIDLSDIFANLENMKDYVDPTSDPQLIPKNIREGIDIWGVIGTMKEGVSGIDYGRVTLSGSTNKITVSHTMGKTPHTAILIPFDSTLSGSDTSNAILQVTSTNVIYGYGTNYKTICVTAKYGSMYTTSGTGTSTTFSASTNSLTLNCPASYYPNGTYIWIAIS